VDVWLVARALLMLAALALLLLPVNLTFSLQARGEPTGGYAAAGGAGLGPVSVTCVAAQALPLRFEVHVLGKKLRSRRAARQTRAEKSSAGKPGWLARVDPLDFALFLLDERRRIALGWLRVRVEYSFANVATTGRVLAALCALSALLPERIHFEQHPSWQLESRASLAVDGRIRLWPGRLALDTLWFLVQSRMLAERPAPPALPAAPR